jgi:hypothetical protein
MTIRQEGEDVIYTENLQTIEGCESPVTKQLIAPAPKTKKVYKKDDKEVDISSFFKSVFTCCNPLLLIPTLMMRRTFTAKPKNGKHLTAESVK